MKPTLCRFLIPFIALFSLTGCPPDNRIRSVDAAASVDVPSAADGALVDSGTDDAMVSDSATVMDTAAAADSTVPFDTSATPDARLPRDGGAAIDSSIPSSDSGPSTFDGGSGDHFSCDGLMCNPMTGVGCPTGTVCSSWRIDDEYFSACYPTEGVARPDGQCVVGADDASQRCPAGEVCRDGIQICRRACDPDSGGTPTQGHGNENVSLAMNNSPDCSGGSCIYHTIRYADLCVPTCGGVISSH